MDSRLDPVSIQKLLDTSREDESAGINRVLSILAQMSLAVLLIFIMIAILFASEFKDKADYYKQRMEKLADTPRGRALIEIQRQKLLLAIEQTNNDYRLNLGHLIFYTLDERNQRQVNTENIITGRRIRNDFIKACAFAQKELADADQFRQTYMATVLSRAGITPSGTVATPDLLNTQNREWFTDQVRKSTTVLYEDTIRLQEDSKEGLAKYYQENLSEVKELQVLAEALITSPTRETINRLTREVDAFVENELERQHVNLLRAGPNRQRETK